MKSWQTFLKHFFAWVVIVMMSSAPVLTFAASAPTPPTPPVAPVDTSVAPAPPVAPEPPTAPGSSDQHAKSTDQSNPLPDVAPPSTSTSDQPSAVTPDSTTSLLASPDVSNQSTGPDSANNTSGSASSQSTVTNDNNGNIVNNLTATSSTGNNKASRNTGSGKVQTAASSFVVNFVNMINSNFIALPGGKIILSFKDIYNTLVGDYIINPLTGERYSLTGARLDDVSNTNTGAGSTNSASSATDNSLDITNNNNGSVVNNFDLTSNTGNSKADQNTGNGSVSTGNANLSLSLLNFINSNFTVGVSGLIGVINIFGNWVGNLVLPPDLLTGTPDNQVPTSVSVSNSNTGANSTNAANANVGQQMNVANNNQATVQNNISATSNTGNNSADKNTGGGSVSTGTASSAVNISNEINKNIFGDTIFQIVVNVLGTWSGVNTLSANALVQDAAGNGGQTITVSNANTGAGSDNLASYSSENGTNISNNNNAVLTNNISATSNTGNNSADKNTGNGAVTTGNSKLAVNIANFVNTNVTANHLVYLVINVFGNWVGNITDHATAANENSGAPGGSTSSSSSTNSQTTVNGFETFTWTNFNATNQVQKTGQNILVNITNNPGTGAPEKLVLGAMFGGNDLGSPGDHVSPTSNFRDNILKLLLGLFVVYVLAVGTYLIGKKINNMKDGR